MDLFWVAGSDSSRTFSRELTGRFPTQLFFQQVTLDCNDLYTTYNFVLGIPSTVDLLAVHVVVGFKDGFGAAHSGTHASYEWYIDSKRIVLYKIRYTVNCARGPV